MAFEESLRGSEIFQVTWGPFFQCLCVCAQGHNSHRTHTNTYDRRSEMICQVEKSESTNGYYVCYYQY